VTTIMEDTDDNSIADHSIKLKSAPPDASSRKSRSSSPVKSILSRAQSIKSHLTGSLSRLNFSLKDEPIEQRPKEPSVDDGRENLTRDGGVEFIPSLNPATLQLAQEDEVNIQVDAGLTTRPETTAVIQSANVNTTVQEQSIIVGDKIISVRIEDGGSLSPVKSHPMIRRPGELCVSSRSGGGVGRQRRRQTSVERENQERIDRENRILLRKILEQHHGVRRSSAIPPPPNKAHKQKYPLSSTGKYLLRNL